MTIDIAQAASVSQNPFSLKNKKIFLYGMQSATQKATSEIIGNMDAEIFDNLNPIQGKMDGLVFFADDSVRSFLQSSNQNKNEIIDFLTLRIVNPFTKIQELINKNQLNEGSAIIIEKICIDSIIAQDNQGYFNIEDGLNSLINSLGLNLAKSNIRINSISTKLKPNQDDYNDFGYAAVYLLSDASRWVTGGNLVITGHPIR
jgi:hypothetical protein